MNLKFGIGVVIAIVLQVSAFVWWTAQQAQTIENLKQQVSELTAKTEQRKQFNMERDIKELKDQISYIKDEYDYDEDLEDLYLYIDTEIDNLDKKLSDRIIKDK